MTNRNMHQDWSSNIKVAFREVRKRAKEANTVPFGEERLTAAQAKERFAGMGEAERAKFIADKGEAEILNMLRGNT